MISVESRDGRKGLGLGRNEEDSELEGGEAYCNHNEDSIIDPDISLSYIEEKLQNILGHFQKDFEGGISAENLGAKFGGYGSFLPTYERSPTRSYARNSQEVNNYDSPRSPKDGRKSSLSSSSASLSARSNLAVGKTASICNFSEGDALPTHAKESTSNCKPVKSTANPSEKRTLKVRIKVGSENLLTRKKDEIYSGLGLDVSPSSSLDDSPTTSEGLCANLQDVQNKSPNSILQMMTSLPVDLLLSPLSEDLIHLTGKEKISGKSEHILVDKATFVSSGMLVNGSHSSKSNPKVLDRKKRKPSEMDNAFTMKLTSEKNSGGEDNIGVLLKKDAYGDMFGCDQLVDDALKLPFLSNLEHSEAVDVSVTSLNKKVKEDTFSGVPVKGFVERVPAQGGRVENLDGRLGSSVKCLEGKINILEKEKAHIPAYSESNAWEGRNSSNGEATGSMEQLVVEKGKSICEEGIKRTVKTKSSGRKKIPKGLHSQANQGSKVSKDLPKIDSSIPLKSERNSHSNGLVHKNDKINLQVDQRKLGDRYKDLFGDLEFEEEDKYSVSAEKTLAKKLKDPKLVERSTIECPRAAKEKRKIKKAKKPSLGEEYPQRPSIVAPPSRNGLISDAAATGAAPLDNDDWVSCDKCKKWRLLPFGTNPKSLPDKWLCRMLNWLPGMNSCSVPEEVTTSTLRALYLPIPASAPAPAPENQSNQPSDPVGISSGCSSIYATLPGPSRQNDVSQVKIISRWKHHLSVDATNPTNVLRPAHNSQFQKNLQISGKSSISDGADDFPVDLCGQQYLRQPSSAAEKNEDCNMDNSMNNRSDRGTNSKIRNRKESGLYCSRASKRNKSEDVSDEAFKKAGHGSSSGLSNNAPGIDQDCRNAMVDMKKNFALSGNSELSILGTSDDCLLHTSQHDNWDIVKKGTGKAHHGSQVPSTAGLHLQPAGDSMGETCESDYSKIKKVRICTSGGQNTGRSKASVGTERRDRGKTHPYSEQNLINTLPKCSLEAADYWRSDTGSLHALAVNSSSSMVSGSRKSKLSHQEVKGSPVESVSSSPLRFPNPSKFALMGRNPVDKVDLQNPGSLTSTGPRGFLHGKDVRNDQSWMVEKSTTLMITGDGHLGRADQDACETHTPERCQGGEKTANHSQFNGSRSKKLYKESSPNSKNQNNSSRSELDRNTKKVSDSSRDHMKPFAGKSKSKRNKFDEQFATPGEPSILKKDASGGISGESKGKGQVKVVGVNGSDGRLDVKKSPDRNNHLQPDHDDKRLSKKLHSGKCNRAEVNGNGSSQSALKGQIETVADPHRISQSQTESGAKVLASDLFENGDDLKTPEQSKKAENQNGQHIHLRHPPPGKHKVRDIGAPSPVQRDSSTQTASSAIKEAKDLKHLADRLKNSGSTESTGLYFRAALKFLHGASLLESGNIEGIKHKGIIQSMDMYSSTAKLCEFCAHEYEKSKDMATAALAYKCMEVAYMRVVYCSHTGARRDCNELQSALQIVFPGESPSSSASDVDNCSALANVGKAALAKVGSPQVSGTNVITARNRSGFMRLLNFAHETNSAMEASRKSRIAFEAASRKPGETHDKESISFLKKALDFSFQDVDGLLHLVRVAMEAISR